MRACLPRDGQTVHGLHAASAGRERSLTHAFYHCICLTQGQMRLFPCSASAGLEEPFLGGVTIQLSAALGGCALSVLAQIRQITSNVLLVPGLGFLGSLIINTEKQVRTVVSLRQGRQFDVGSKIACRSDKRRGSPCVSPTAAGPCTALLQRWSDSQMSSLLCLGTQSAAQPADASCPLPDSSMGLLVLLCTSSSSPLCWRRGPCRWPMALQMYGKPSYMAMISYPIQRPQVVLKARPDARQVAG